ncbi:MAG: calcium-binding protein, partial [Roseiarcus sp.]
TGIAFADGTTLQLPHYAGAPLTFTWQGTAANTTLTGSALGQNAFDLGAGGDTVVAASSNDAFSFEAGDGEAKLESVTGGMLTLGAGIGADDLLFQTDASGDLIIGFRDDADDGIDVTNDLSQQWYGAQSRLTGIAFADGTTLQLPHYAGAPLTFTWQGTAANTTLTGSALGGGDTVTAGPTPAGQTNAYLFGAGDGAATIDAGVGATQGTVDFAAGVTTSDLWFEQQGDNLQVDLMGTTDSLTIDDWFGGANSAAAQNFVTADGSKLDSQVGQLVSAMAAYSAANTGFNPTLAAQIPPDPALQGAVAAAWRH